MTLLEWVAFANSIAIPVGLLIGFGLASLAEWIKKRRLTRELRAAREAMEAT